MIEAREVRSVLAELALEVVSGKDGRALSDEDKARLGLLALVAERLGLAEYAECLRRLAAVAERGYTRDLEHAALKLLGG